MALVVLGLLVSVAPVAAETADRPPLWSGRAGAAGVRVFFTTEPPAVPVPTLVDFRAPEGHTAWDSSGLASARASSFYPGAAGIGGLQLLCDFGAPCPEQTQQFDYPFTAFAEHPSTPDAETASGFGKAHAGRDFVATTARPGNVLPLDALADVVSFGGASASTRQEFLEDGVLTVRAVSTLTDVVLGGGALTVASLEVTSVSRAQAGGPSETRSSVTLAGVRTSEGAVIVGDRGITLGDRQAGGEATTQINEALAAALEGTPVGARVVGPSSQSDGGRTSGQATGLVVDIVQPVSGPGLPGADRIYRTYLASLVLGDASTTAFASDAAFGIAMSGLADTTDAGSQPTGPTTAGPVGATGGSSLGPAVGSGSTADAPGLTPATDTGAAAGGPQDPEVADSTSTPTEGGEQGFALLAGETTRAVTNGYAGLVALAAGVFVASRVGARRIARS